MYCLSKRLTFTPLDLFVARLVTYVTYAALGALTFVLVASDLVSLKAAGLLIALFLGDRLFHINEGDRTIRELEEGRRGNVAQVLTPASHRVLIQAMHRAANAGDFLPELGLMLLGERDVQEALRRLNVPRAAFAALFRETLGSGGAKGDVATVAVTAYEGARVAGEYFIEPRNLFTALMRSGCPAAERALVNYALTVEDVANAVVFSRYERFLRRMKRVPATLGGFARTPVGWRSERRRVMNRAWTARPTPYTDLYGTDLTALARRERIGFLIGHRRELDGLLHALARPGKPNALLVGPAGVGKTSIIAHVAFRIVKDDVPEVLFDRRLVELDVGKILMDAGTEEVAGRLRRIADEIAVAGNVVLFIPDVHNLFKPIGYEKGLAPIDVLLPVFERSDIPVIATSFPREMQFLERNSAFLELFERVDVEEVSPEEAVQILTYYALILERSERVFIRFPTLKRCVAFAYRYLHDEPLPSSAIDLLREAVARTRALTRGVPFAWLRPPTVLSEETVYQTVESLSKIPVERPGKDEAEKLLHLEDVIHERLVDQETAVSAVSQALREYRSGLSRSGAPIATFLFVGPTGVGKTELAKILARVQFGAPDALARFDLSEYQARESIHRLIGTPDGEKRGELTEAVRHNPYCLVLLDEFEKAHPDVLNLFLQVFDDGRLTDSSGQTVSFEHTIIIATSNAHSDFIKESVDAGKEMSEIAAELTRRLTSYFKPELLNRFSRVVVFRTLTQEEIKIIAALLVKETAETLMHAHGVSLRVDDAALTEIVRLGFSPAFGARPLRQVISDHIRSGLADMILRQDVKRGDEVTVTHGDGEFKIEKSA